jgi:hypothetical protein
MCYYIFSSVMVSILIESDLNIITIIAMLLVLYLYKQ